MPIACLTLFRMRRKYSKRTKQWCAVKIPVPKTYKYINNLLLNIFKKRITSKDSINKRIGLSAEDPRQIAPTIAGIAPPSISELVEAHQTRF